MDVSDVRRCTDHSGNLVFSSLLNVCFLSQLQSFNPDELTGLNGGIYRYETV